MPEMQENHHGSMLTGPANAALRNGASDIIKTRFHGGRNSGIISAPFTAAQVKVNDVAQMVELVDTQR